MKIIPLSEGHFVVDKSKRFVPFKKNAEDLRDMPVGSMLVEVQPFVVVTSHDILLLDTGLGLVKDGLLQLHKNLIDKGIHPNEVSKVLVSHCHDDHSGGIHQQNDDTLIHEATFPLATYYLQKKEYETVYEKSALFRFGKKKDCLMHLHNLVMLEGSGVLDDYIKYEVTGGHSPYHQVFWIIDGGEIIFYGGDVAPQYRQMKSRFIAKYDFDGQKSFQLRQHWWRMGAKEKWTFLFYHDIETPIHSF